MTKLVTGQLLLAIALRNSRLIHQLNINNVFLHGHLYERIYSVNPEGYFKAKDGEVCSLNIFYMILNKLRDNNH